MDATMLTLYMYWLTEARQASSPVARRLKQGDPLAPFLFLVAAEGLSGLVRKAEENMCFKGFVVNENLSVLLL